MHFNVDFMHFDRRTFRFGTILSVCFDHILIGGKIAKNFEKGQICFGQISMKSQFPIKVWGPERTSWTGQEEGQGKNQKK